MTIRAYFVDGIVLTAAPAVMGTAVDANTKRVITAAAIVNTTAAPIQVAVALVPAGAANPIDASHIMISGRTIASGESYPCPELVGHGLNAGGSVQAWGNGLTFKYAAKDIING